MAEIAEQTGVSRASVHRLLNALVSEGYVLVEGKPRRYYPSLRVWEMTTASLDRYAARETVLPYAIELAVSSGHVTAISLYERGDVTFTDRIHASGDRIMPTLLNLRAPALTTAAGRALLAQQPPDEIERVVQRGVPHNTPYTKTNPEALRDELRLTRQRGYGVVEREINLEMCGVGFAVLDRDGKPAVGLGILVYGAFPNEFFDRVVPMALTLAQRASMELGYRPAVPAIT